MTCVSEEDFARYRRVVDEYYALVDRVLGQWMRRADEDGATLIVNSDHGFKWGAERPCERSSLNPEHGGVLAPIDGVFAAYGARVKPSPERGSASVLDLAPTVAALIGLRWTTARPGPSCAARFPGLGIPRARISRRCPSPCRRLDPVGEGRNRVR